MAVCLHCLHTARVEARERRRRVIVRFSAWTLSLIVVGVVGAAAVNAAMHPAETTAAPVGTRRASAKSAAVPKRDSTLTVASATVVQQGGPTPITPAADTTAQLVSAPVVASPAPARTDSAVSHPPVAAPTPLLRPVIPIGRTDLRDSLYAERRGDTVVVHFDTSPTRTRRADKFEAIVRQTLGSVYGAAADTLLATVPAGQLLLPNELLTTLPSRGIGLTTAAGARIRLWPETRPGRDGPLVVAYRAVVQH